MSLPAITQDACPHCGQHIPPKRKAAVQLAEPFEPRPRKGGRQISYGVALRGLTAYIVRVFNVPERDAEREARRVLNPCLPIKQRKPRTR